MCACECDRWFFDGSLRVDPLFYRNPSKTVALRIVLHETMPHGPASPRVAEPDTQVRLWSGNRVLSRVADDTGHDLSVAASCGAGLLHCKDADEKWHGR